MKKCNSLVLNVRSQCLLTLASLQIVLIRLGDGLFLMTVLKYSINRQLISQ